MAKNTLKFLNVGVDACMACLGGGDKRTWSTGQMSRLDFVRRILWRLSKIAYNMEKDGLVKYNTDFALALIWLRLSL